MADIKIIGTPISNYVRAIRMLCEEKGVPYTLEPVMPHTPEVQAIHPAGQVPCLKHGDVTLFESKAIAHYIENHFPKPQFVPNDSLKSSLVEQWVSFVNVKVDRWIMREYVVPSLFFDEETGPDKDKLNAALPEIEQRLQTLDKAVASTGYLVGDSLTYADLNVLPMLVALTLFPETKEMLEKHEALSAYVAKLSARPSFQNTAPPDM